MMSRSTRVMAAAAPKAVPAAEAGRAQHVVARGETLSGIATTYGVGLAALRDLNGIPAGGSVIHTGQVLRLPVGGTAAPTPVDRRHVVRRGDTLLRVATAYGVRLIDLLHANTLTAHSIIHPGQTLRIP
jgi:N-acetylmuramoyl-L-alanine amidase